MLLKGWPVFTGYSPVLMRARDSEAAESVMIDLTNCDQIDAVSLAILLMRCLRLERNSPTLMNFIVTTPENKRARVIFRKSNFWNLLYARAPNKDLFLSGNRSNGHAASRFQLNNGLVQYVFPIYYLNFSSSTARRTSIDKFEGWLLRVLKRFNEFDFNINQFAIIVKEIIKNSADHTAGDAAFGLSAVIHEYRKQRLSLEFSVSDEGGGVHNNIKRHLDENRRGHEGFAETYQVALQLGGSTKVGNGVNLGMGMPLIMEGAKRMGMEISLFDARSHAILTKINAPTRDEIRRRFVHVGQNVCFCYYGSFSCESKV